MGTLGGLIVKLSPLDAPPPGVGFVTVTIAVPGVATSLARIEAVSWVAFTNVVVRAVPLKFTTEPLMKFVPFRVSVNAPEAAVTEEGESDVSVGKGFAGTVIWKFTAFDVPPPCGFVTVTNAVPAVAMSLAGIEAVSCVAFTNVVGRATPLKLTTAPLMKFDPFTVSVNPAEPATAEAGTRDVITGAEVTVSEPSWFTVNVWHPAVIVSTRAVLLVFCATV